ncbi:hypothetical protein NDU88_006479 [Pleurodeles waltl]|uniref:Uncharacterized protein n=1 Tax=Pleurodeles waltl TaxID=8319 RepID=A0AAV7SPL9_PLEWA|nr:hypothetical protein NDU88_006479 [Pleurodeles waltl]
MAPVPGCTHAPYKQIGLHQGSVHESLLGASSGALSDLRIGVSRVSFPGAPSQGASPVLFLDPDQVTGVPLSFSPQGVRGKHGSAQRSGASRFGSSLGTRLFYGLRSPRVTAPAQEAGDAPGIQHRARCRQPFHFALCLQQVRMQNGGRHLAPFHRTAFH